MSKLEKGVSGTDQTSSLLSIAISLKRIADNMERVEITNANNTIDVTHLTPILRKNILKAVAEAKTRGLTR